MIRYLLLLPIMSATAMAHAAQGGACAWGPFGCGGLGLGWIPIAVLLQLVFLYLFQGGPGVFLSRFVGNDDDLRREQWGLLQVGFPVALVLAFPALIVLTFIDRWIVSVGLVEIGLVQGGYWMLLARWTPQQDDGGEGVAAPDVAPAPVAQGVSPGFIGLDAATPIPSRSAVDAGVAALLPRAAIDGIPLFPGAVRPPAPAAGPGWAIQASAGGAGVPDAASARVPAAVLRRGNSAEKTIERLAKIYMWDDVGADAHFKRCRKLPVAQLITDADAEKFGEALLDGMRAVCRHTAAVFHRGVDATTLPSLLAIHAGDGLDEYSADVMQRLTYSVLMERERLFIDQTDVEIFGEDLVECLYRLALSEVRTMVGWIPPVGPGALPAHPSYQ